MAQITLVMQANAALEAALQEPRILYLLETGRFQPLEDATRFITGVLVELLKRRIRVLLEEEESPATTMDEEIIGDWLTSVKNFADNLRASVGEQDEDYIEKFTTRQEELEREYERLIRSAKELSLATCCAEQPTSRVVTLPRERDHDKTRIIDSIKHQAESKTQTDEPIILAIFGTAGVGKTTLVKSIFHDPQLFQGYAKVWVDTSEVRELELTKKIYLSIVSSQALQGAELLPVPEDGYYLDDRRDNIARLLADKKLLLVLDDLRVGGRPRIDQDSFSSMADLKGMLSGVVGGNLVVIVTTANKGIAGNITSTTIMPYQLHPLSHDTCWAIIKQACGFEARIAGNNHQEAEAAERIGREISGKCCGLPLAAKAIGLTMRSLDIPQGWSALAEDVWNIGRGYSGDSQLLLPTLAVLSDLKQAYCISPLQWLSFAACAFFFTKSRSISRDDMDRFCNALEIRFVPSILLDRLLLRETSASNARAVSKNGMLVLADDITLGLARYVLGDRLVVVDGRRNNAERRSNAYLAVITHWDTNQQLHLSILPAGIRALRFEDCPGIVELSDSVFESTKNLIFLDLSGCSLKKLPDSIGELGDLRYLKAPGIQDQVLPWLQRLWRLEYLSLHGSPALSDLTEAFGQIKNLEHLDLSGCSGLNALPDSFKMLERLKHLDLSGCSGLKALPDSFSMLCKLQQLDLSGCSGLKALPDSFSVNWDLQHLDLSGCSGLKALPGSLSTLCKLQHLDLSGCSGLKALPDSFSMLCKLQHLNLSGCSGLKALPDSFKMLERLQHLDLSGCSALKELPDSFKLERLKHLDLSGCWGLKALPDSFSMPDVLQHLNLSGWSCVGITEALQRLNVEKLHHLNLSHRCTFVDDWFHLTRNLTEVLPKLKEVRSLVLSSCLNPVCYTSVPDKSKSYVEDCFKDLVKLNLQHLDLSQNTFLEELPDSIGKLQELRSLDLSGCFRLQSLPESIGDLQELRSLDLSGCFRLELLPESIGGLKELCSLDLSGCFRLGSLPERISELEELQTLDLSGCPQFDQLTEEVKQKLVKLRSYGSLTVITGREEYHLSQVGGSEERSMVAGDDLPQSRASTSQDASFVHPTSGAEPEITDADH